MKKRIRQSKNAGMTLVELIVTFALLSIFLVCATMIISDTIESYYNVKATSYGMEVTGILQDWIDGQLESAAKTQITMADGETSAVMLAASDRVEFTNRDGSHVALSLEDGYLCQYFYTKNDDETTKTLEWAFDPKTYMGYTITSLEFAAAGDGYPANVLRVTMKLHNGTYGDYETTTYVRCYNLEDGDITFSAGTADTARLSAD